MNVNLRYFSLLGVWAAAVVVIGSVLTSYHQPFQTPQEGVLALVRDPGPGSWRTLHILSGSCGCSQRVMQHLLVRHRLSGVTEQVLLIQETEADLPGTNALIKQLDEQGFPVTRIAAKDIPKQAGLRGVPLLIVASPEHRIAYVGGYGSRGDQDGAIFDKLRTGVKIDGEPVLGCAVGSRIRRQSDPFGLKY